MRSAHSCVRSFLVVRPGEDGCATACMRIRESARGTLEEAQLELARIAVIGSIACDEVARLATPLRPGAHLTGTRTGIRLGGGGANTAVPLAAAGHHTILLSAVGVDAAGHALLAELAGAGVDVSGVTRCAHPTTHSLILVEPCGERTVINLARCEEAAPPTRLLELACEAVYARNRRGDLAPLLARKANECLVVAHVPPVEPACRPAHVIVGSASDLAPYEVRDPLTLGPRLPRSGCAGSSSLPDGPVPGRSRRPRCSTRRPIASTRSTRPALAMRLPPGWFTRWCPGHRCPRRSRRAYASGAKRCAGRDPDYRRMQCTDFCSEQVAGACLCVLQGQGYRRRLPTFHRRPRAGRHCLFVRDDAMIPHDPQRSFAPRA